MSIPSHPFGPTDASESCTHLLQLCREHPLEGATWAQGHHDQSPAAASTVASIPTTSIPTTSIPTASTAAGFGDESGDESSFQVDHLLRLVDVVELDVVPVDELIVAHTEMLALMCDSGAELLELIDSVLESREDDELDAVEPLSVDARTGADSLEDFTAEMAFVFSTRPELANADACRELFSAVVMARELRDLAPGVDVTDSDTEAWENHQVEGAMGDIDTELLQLLGRDHEPSRGLDFDDDDEPGGHATA